MKYLLNSHLFIKTLGWVGYDKWVRQGVRTFSISRGNMELYEVTFPEGFKIPEWVKENDIAIYKKVQSTPDKAEEWI